MAIVTRYYPNVYPEEGGVFCPLMTCDFCGEVIEEHGNATWPWDEPGRVYFTHKHCQRAFERPRPGVWLAEELDVFISHLVANSKLANAHKGVKRPCATS
ncbi:hypothetical protein [Thermanaeromonas sp. C210]|uniref:hypothetical protein n=1 Tax=Thermanaeromonas sp. C210 TaxID=2731925 RepID=UPI00155C7FB4|nr:hypothetical protein [Thermanaeromonas sp. C210]GFN22167.1 hypothetical protein TAMC210_04830 [Thermanaeromonas sp. C210]